MRPTVGVSITTAENGYVVRRIDSHDSQSGDHVFNDLEKAFAFIKEELACVAAIRVKWEKRYGKPEGKD